MEQIRTVRRTAPILTLIQAAFFLAAGIVMLFLNEEDLTFFIVLITDLVLIFSAIKGMIEKMNDNRMGSGIVTLLVLMTLMVLLTIFTGIFEKALIIMLIVIGFVVFGARVLVCIHLWVVEGPGFFRSVLSGLLSLAFAVALIIAHSTDAQFAVVSFIAGIYLIIYAVTLFADFFAGLSHADRNAARKTRRTHFVSPNLVAATKTNAIIARYNKLLEKDDSLTRLVDMKEDSEFKEVNFEILVHTSRIAAKRFGHVDIAIGDTVYSYGCYDATTCKFGGFVAGGTFVTVPKEPYIDNCLTAQRKYIIGYGCCLSDEQLSAVKQRIAEIYSKTEELVVNPAEEDTRPGGDGAITITRLGGKVYKVLEGPFKIYFAISSNCVQLADTIIGRAGLDSMNRGSLRTPGAYYEMMENMFTRSNTRVIRRTAYLQTAAGAKKLVDEEAAREAAERKSERNKNPND